MPLYRIYIGANNQTGTVELDVIKTFFSANYSSFTITNTYGVFQDKEEPSIIVTIATEDILKLKKHLCLLREKLQQDGIGIESNGLYERITNMSIFL